VASGTSEKETMLVFWMRFIARPDWWRGFSSPPRRVERSRENQRRETFMKRRLAGDISSMDFDGRAEKGLFIFIITVERAPASGIKDSERRRFVRPVYVDRQPIAPRHPQISSPPLEKRRCVRGLSTKKKATSLFLGAQHRNTS